MACINWASETRLTWGRSIRADEDPLQLPDHSRGTFRKISLEIWTGKSVLVAVSYPVTSLGAEVAFKS